MVLLHPAGYIAQKESDLLIASAILISLIVVPVLVAIAIIAYRYRHTNVRAAYDPEWEHSTRVELIIWAAPMMIIIALGALTWVGTHKLDPYRPINKSDVSQSVLGNGHPLEVDVVSMEWKWLFLYPQYGIATVNQVAAPVNVPINFKLTSATMMDSFLIPSLAGQIYTMPGMQTVLHAVINKPGSYRGFSANFSGHGFTDMRFRFVGMMPPHFARWIQSIKASGGVLDRRAYLKLARPTRNEPVHHYRRYAPNLYNAILNRCVRPGQMCISRIMAIDAHGGNPLGQR